MRPAALLLLAVLAHAEEPWRIGSEGAVLRASRPETLTRPIVFERTGTSGLEATFIARSLRGLRDDDWRRNQRIAGTRRDQVVHHPEGAPRSLVRRELAAPLATVIELGPVPEDAGTLLVELDGPLAGAGLMAWRADRHGRWFQRLAEPSLRHGSQRVEIDLSETAELRPVGHDAAWNPLTASESSRAGLLIYADRPLHGSVLADARWLPRTQRPKQPTLTML